MWGLRWLETLLQDLRYGARMLRNNLGFTAVTLLTLALVIGASTAIFSAIYQLALRRLPYRESGRLVMLWESNHKTGQEHIPIMEGSFPILLSQTKTFDGMAAFIPPLRRGTIYSFKLWRTEETVATADSTSELSSVLGVAPFLGRTFVPSEDIYTPNRPPVAILSFSYWMRHYGGSHEVIDRTLDLNVFGVRTQCTIVGVMPEGFDFPYPLCADKPDVWLNLSYFERFSRGNNFWVVARIKPDVDLRQAQADVDTVAARIRAEFPRYYKDESVRVVPMQSELIRDVKTILWILLGALGLVLLIGCANVGNLLLARAVSREREMAIRAALGAGRPVLIRQMLTEAMLLAIGGGILGLLLAFSGLHTLLALLPPSLYVPRLDTVALDPRVLALTAGVSVLATAMFGVVPSLRLSRPDLSQTIQSGSTQTRAGRSILWRPGSFLLISEVSLALPLLVSTFLLAKSLQKLLEVNRLFQPEHLLAVQIGFSNAALGSWPNFLQTETSLYHQFEQRVAGMPGVRSVALVDRFPLSTLREFPSQFKADGGGLISQSFEPAEMHSVSPSYFEMIGAQLLHGRCLADTDTMGSLPVAVINEAMAERYWRDTDPLGRKLTPMSRLGGWNDATYTVVGVIREPKRFGEGGTSQPAVFFPFAQAPWPSASVVVRAAGDPHSIASALHACALQILPGQMFVGRPQAGGEIVSESSARLRFTTLLLSVFACLALLLAAVGIFGLVSHYTAERTHEIGVRMALGATPKNVLQLVLKEGMALVGLGVLIGLAIAFGLARGMASMLYGVRPADSSAFCAAPLLLFIVALLAIYIPARRATKVDPVVALRYE
jgi:putative ABC transport system permease protein